jgi:hypothetical protein
MPGARTSLSALSAQRESANLRCIRANSPRAGAKPPCASANPPCAEVHRRRARANPCCATANPCCARVNPRCARANPRCAGAKPRRAESKTCKFSNKNNHFELETPEQRRIVRRGRGNHRGQRQNITWHGGPARESRAGCACHGAETR